MAKVSVARVSAGDHEFHLNRAGDSTKPAVLFPHGAGPGATGASNWQAVPKELGDEFYCLAPDVCGHWAWRAPHPNASSGLS
jgi:2-hydroxymuconate-semialdehyde hydrolase